MLAVIHSEEDGVRIHDDFEDKDMLKNVGISSQRSIDDAGTGQQCLVWRKMSGGIFKTSKVAIFNISNGRASGKYLEEHFRL